MSFAHCHVGAIGELTQAAYSHSDTPDSATHHRVTAIIHDLVASVLFIQCTVCTEHVYFIQYIFLKSDRQRAV